MINESSAMWVLKNIRAGIQLKIVKLPYENSRSEGIFRWKPFLTLEKIWLAGIVGDEVAVKGLAALR